MKRLLHILALIVILCVFLSAVRLSAQLPGNTGELVEKKYAGWSGVLQIWLSSRWSCTGSFHTWLNRCAALFEKDHPGIYIECSSVAEAALRDLHTSGLRPPEMILFSPGVLTDDDGLIEIEAEVRKGLAHEKAVPICMGGYICVSNPALFPAMEDAPAHLADDSGHSFSLAAAAFISDASGIELTDPGIDLGLPASASPQRNDLNSFIRGEIPLLIISQKELARLSSLRDEGKGPDWECRLSGGAMIADQLLLAALPAAEDKSADERSKLAAQFIRFLLTEECQSMLSDIGAFPAADMTIYPAASIYAPMESMLARLPLLAPDFFAEYPSAEFEAIVRNSAETASRGQVFTGGKS